MPHPTNKPTVKPNSPARDVALAFLTIPLVIAFWGGLIWAAVRFFFPARDFPGPCDCPRW